MLIRGYSITVKLIDRHLYQVLLIVAVLAAIFLHVPLAELALGRDQGNWSTAGMAMNHGLIFWRDYLHFNLPGLAVAFSVALRFTDDPRVAAMLINLCATLALIWGLYALLRETVGKTAGAWAAFLFVSQWSILINTQTIAQKDTMAMPGIIIATWLVLAGLSSHKKLLYLYLAGCLVLVSTLFKPLFAVAGILLACALVFRHYFSTRTFLDKELLKELSALLLGALSIIAGLLCYLYIHDALEDAYMNAYKMATAYAGIKSTPLVNLVFVLMYFVFLMGVGNLLFWSFLLTYGTYLFSKLKSSKKYWLLVPFATALFTYCIQGKAFGYQAMPFAVSCFLLAGIAMGGLQGLIFQRKGKVSNYSLKAVVVVFSLLSLLWAPLFFMPYGKNLLPLWFGEISRKEYIARGDYIDDYVSPYVKEHLAVWVSENTLKDDRILVWGMGCELYTLSNRLYSSHSPYDFILSNERFFNQSPEWINKKRKQFISDLKEQKPKIILITLDDDNDLEPLTSKESVADIAGFTELLLTEYDYFTTFDRFEIYKVKGSRLDDIKPL